MCCWWLSKSGGGDKPLQWSSGDEAGMLWAADPDFGQGVPRILWSLAGRVATCFCIPTTPYPQSHLSADHVGPVFPGLKNIKVFLSSKKLSLCCQTPSSTVPSLGAYAESCALHSAEAHPCTVTVFCAREVTAFPAGKQNLLTKRAVRAMIPWTALYLYGGTRLALLQGPRNVRVQRYSSL